MTDSDGKESQSLLTAIPVLEENGKEQEPVEGPSPSEAYHEEVPFPVEPHESTTLPSQAHNPRSTKDTWKPVEEARHPESYRPAPDESPDTSNPVSPYEEHRENATSHPEPDATTEHEEVESGDPSQHYDILEGTHMPTENTQETETPQTAEGYTMSGANATNMYNVSPEVHQESGMAESQEDQTIDVHLEHVTETELIYPSTSVSGEPEEAIAGGVEETTSPNHEEPEIHSTPRLPYFHSTTPAYPPVEKDSLEQSANPLPDDNTTLLVSSVTQTGESSGSATEQTGDLVTPSPLDLDPTGNIGLIPTSEYSKSS